MEVSAIKVTDKIDLMLSRKLDIGHCESVCLALGPYRNLTTLTAATLFLHPHCQVLNHAGVRIYGNSEVDFLSDFSRERLDRFIQFAIRISSKGERGDVGGSITHSHAFDSNYGMKELHEKNGAELVKKDIRCLFWKESLRTSNLIREKKVDLQRIFEKEARLRFLLPIRNPMDCAISNLKTGHVEFFNGLSGSSSPLEVTQVILDEICWFAELEERFPGRFFHYFEHEISREMLSRLAVFLGLEPMESWLSNSLSAMKTKPSYEHDGELLSFYRKYVTDSFSRFPRFSEGLLRFA